MNANPATPREEELLALRQQLQSARLELETAQRALSALTVEIEMLRARQGEQVRESAGTQLEAVLKDAAGPSAQLITQAYLLEHQGKPVQARDILNVARRLLRALEKHGLTIEGQPGASVSYDPDRHTPLSADSRLHPGQSVTVRIPGASLNGKVLARAAVEPGEEAA